MLRSLSMLVLAALAAGCGDVRPASIYTGTLEGSDVRLGIAREAGALVAYVCGGPSTYTTHSRWFSGSVHAGGAALEKDGWTLELGFEGTEAAGTLRAPDGAALAFTAAAGDGDTSTGVYDATDDGCRTGVLVVQERADGAPLLQGTWCDRSGDVAQVEPGVRMPRGRAGFEVMVNRPAGRSALFVEPVLP